MSKACTAGKSCKDCKHLRYRCFLTEGSLKKHIEDIMDIRMYARSRSWRAALQKHDILHLYSCGERQDYFTALINPCEHHEPNQGVLKEQFRGFMCFDCMRNKTRTIRNIRNLEYFFTCFLEHKNKVPLLQQFKTEGYARVYWCSAYPQMIYKNARGTKNLPCAARETEDE